jgi:hypothetical protein
MSVSDSELPVLSEMSKCPEALPAFEVAVRDCKVDHFIFLRDQPCRIVSMGAPFWSKRGGFAVEFRGVNMYTQRGVRETWLQRDTCTGFSPTYVEYQVRAIAFGNCLETMPGVVDKRSKMFLLPDEFRQAITVGLDVDKDVFVRVMYTPWLLDNDYWRARSQIESVRVA